MTYTTIAQGDSKFYKYLKATHKKFCNGSLKFLDQPPYLSDQVAPKSAEYILHVNADSIFTDNFDIEVMMEDGKIVMPYTEYETLFADQSIPPTMIPVIEESRQKTEEALDQPLSAEFARRMPLLYPISMYQEFRDYMESNHGTYKINNPSYFNLLGAYCYIHKHDDFIWVNTEETILKELPFIQSVADKDIVIIL